MDNQQKPPPGPGDDDFATLFAASERRDASGGGARRRPRLHPGDKVRGKVLSVGRETVFLELDGKQGEGMLDLVELRDAEGKLTVAPGDMIDAVVAEAGRKGGMVVLRRGLGRGAGGRVDLAEAFRHGLAVEGTVGVVNKGGVEVSVSGERAFCPVSQLDLRHVEDPSIFVGQKLLFRIARYEEGDRRGPNIVLSRRALLEEEARGRAVEARANLAVGAVVSGVVTALKDYGAFVDLGGIEGMIHVSELGFSRVARPADVLSIGQQVSVQVIRMDTAKAGTGDQKRPGQREQIALSLKAQQTDPWDSATVQFAAGSRVRGTVTRVTTFGAFVELVPGVEGLVHVSELGDAGVSRAGRGGLKVGDTPEVTVLSVDRERRRLSLSLAPPDEPIDPEARAVMDRTAAAARPGRLGTFGDLFKGLPPGAKR